MEQPTTVTLLVNKLKDRKGIANVEWFPLEKKLKIRSHACGGSWRITGVRSEQLTCDEWNNAVSDIKEVELVNFDMNDSHIAWFERSNIKLNHYKAL